MTVSRKLCALLVFSITAHSYLDSALCSAHCGPSPQVLDSNVGQIQSSSYHTWYYRFGSICDCWVIKGSENEPIVFRFSRFFVKCDNEWVSLESSAGGEPVVLCGKTLPEPQRFPGGNITVVHHFFPHQYPVSKFILSYSRESENCPKTSFQCPGGQCIPLFLRCNGRIDCPDDNVGTDEQGCDDEMDYPEIQTTTDGNKDSERQMVTEKTKSLVRTTPGYAYEDLWQPERAQGQLGQEQSQTKTELLISTTPVEWPCGGLFQTFYGTFSSPAPRGNRLFCVWSLDPQDSRALRLDLRQLELGPLDRLTIYNRGEGKGDVIKNISSTSNYKSIHVESHTGLMSLTYETFPGSEGTGFKATFHVVSYCPPSEYRCGGSMGGCYTKEQRCDGKWDCPETGKDEEACRGCGLNQFACGMVGQKAVAPNHFAGRPVCYPVTERCNYQLYCADLSDEKDCTVCQPGTFHCDSDRCLFESWRCDGQVDCKDGTDELNCTVMLPRKVITAATLGSLVCGLLLVIAMGCTCKLYSLRTREYSMFAPISRQEAELIQQQAPPSYGQLIAQGVIPPVEDFPTENPNETSTLSLRGILQLLRQDAANSPHRRRRPRFVRRAVRRMRRWGLIPRQSSRPSQSQSSNQQQSNSAPAGDQPAQATPTSFSSVVAASFQPVSQKLGLLSTTQQQLEAPLLQLPSTDASSLPPPPYAPPAPPHTTPCTPQVSVPSSSPSSASIFQIQGLSISLFRASPSSSSTSSSSSSTNSMPLSASPSFSSSSSDDEVLLIPLSEDNTSEDDVPMLT